MKTIYCTGIGFLCLLFSACGPLDLLAERGSGRMTSEERLVGGFTGVNLATMGTLFIEVGNTESLRIEAEDNLIAKIDTDIRNGILNIKTGRNGSLEFTLPVKYYLTVRELNSIGLFSSGDAQAPDLHAGHFDITVASSGNLRMGNLQADTVSINLHSSGDVSIGIVKAKRLDVNISSSGDLNIAGGEVGRQTVALNSSGDYRSRSLASDETLISLNSSGDADIRVRSLLNANLNSSGDLKYWGTPSANINKHSSGDAMRQGN